MRKILVMGLCLLLASVAAAQDDGDDLPEVEQLTVEVLSERPHDTEAFTQGLLLAPDGLLYESTGRYGLSDLRAVDPETGEVLREFDLPDEFFAEGLALVDDRLIQLTWRERAAIVYDLEAGADENTFEPMATFQYQNEGWGLCYDGESLYHSDGTNTITVRDPETFAATESFRVTLYGAFVDQLNELECVGDSLYSNVWQSNTILEIDKETGEVIAAVDASDLLSLEERLSLGGGAVLNGIAYDAENDVFFITGKLWPTLFEVQFVPAETDDSSG